MTPGIGDVDAIENQEQPLPGPDESIVSLNSERPQLEAWEYEGFLYDLPQFRDGGPFELVRDITVALDGDDSLRKKFLERYQRRLLVCVDDETNMQKQRKKELKFIHKVRAILPCSDYKQFLNHFENCITGRIDQDCFRDILVRFLQKRRITMSNLQLEINEFLNGLKNINPAADEHREPNRWLLRRKKQKDEILIRDKQGLSDLLTFYSSITSTIKELEELLDHIREDDEKAKNEIRSSVLGYVSIVNIRLIERLYRDHGADLSESLFKNTVRTVPVVLQRLKQKRAEIIKLHSGLTAWATHSRLWCSTLRALAELYEKNQHESPSESREAVRGNM